MGNTAPDYETLSLFAEREVADLFVVRRLILFAAEAIDQWFETFQNYEVTLVSLYQLLLHVSHSLTISAISLDHVGRNGCRLS